MVSWGGVVGKILLVIRNPASRLPSVKRFIGFSKAGLFSLM